MGKDYAHEAARLFVFFTMVASRLATTLFFSRVGSGLLRVRVQLNDREKILGCPIEREPAGVVVAKDQEDHWHEVEDPLLHRVAAFRR